MPTVEGVGEKRLRCVQEIERVRVTVRSSTTILHNQFDDVNLMNLLFLKSTEDCNSLILPRLNLQIKYFVHSVV